MKTLCLICGQPTSCAIKHGEKTVGYICQDRCWNQWVISVIPYEDWDYWLVPEDELYPKLEN